MHTSLLERCLKKKELASARHIQCLVIRDGLDSIGHFWNDHLIRLFAICGNLDGAKRTFSKVGKPGIFTWNAIISAFKKLGEPEKAMDLYVKMHMDGVIPDVVTYLCMLNACGGLKRMDESRVLHHEVVNNRMDVHINVGSTLVHVYAENGQLKDARGVFDMLHSRNVVTWGAMISGYVRNGEAHVGLKLFQIMQGEGLSPSNFTFSCVLKACGITGAIHEGKLLHCEIMRQNLEDDVVIGSTLIGMYLDCGSIEDAKRVFDRLENHDIISWGVMMSGYAANGYAHHAFDLFKQLQCSTLKPNIMIYLPMLQASGSMQSAQMGRLIHHEVTERGLESLLNVKNTLIDMYAKCGCLQEACDVFEQLPERDLVSWGALIFGYVEYRHPVSVLKLLDRMLDENIKPNSVILLYGVKASSMFASFLQGRSIHDLILRNGLECQETLGNALIDMYAQSGDLIDARAVFDSMPERGELSWGIMFGGYATNGCENEVFELYDKMQEQGWKPNKAMLLSILNACIGSGAIWQGRIIHTHIIREGFELDIAIGSAVSEMYLRYGTFNEVFKVFDALPNHDVVLFGTMIEGFALQGHDYLAFKLFVKMRKEGIAPSKAIFLSILKACNGLGAGLTVHNEIVECKLETDVEIGSTLVNMYSKCGYLEEANQVFISLDGLNLVAWSALISGYVHQEQNFTAIKLYKRMQEKGIQPDCILYTTLLTAFINTGALGHGRIIHGELVKFGFDCDKILEEKLVDTYKCYENVHEGSNLCKSPVYQHISLDESIQITHDQFHTSNSMKALFLVAQCREGYFLNSLNYYSTRSENRYFGCIIDLLGRVGFLKESECFIKTMPMLPDTLAWIMLLSNCKTHGTLDLGKRCFLNTMDCATPTNVLMPMTHIFVT